MVKDDTLLKITAIVTIAAMEITAMVEMHMDGVLLSSVIGVISGMAGYQIGINRKK